MPAPLLSDDLALSQSPAIVFEPNLVWAAPRTINMAIDQEQDDDSFLAYDLTGCTFKLYVWKDDAARTVIINGETMGASGNVVPIVITKAQAGTLPRVGYVIMRLTVDTAAIEERPLFYGRAQVVGG